MKVLNGPLALCAGIGRIFVAPLLLLLCTYTQAAVDIWDDVEHGYVANGDVKIHYAALGEGPLVIMIHGFPDFWYSWRHQMAGLQDSYQVVAIDQRGYNLSSQPESLVMTGEGRLPGTSRSLGRIWSISSLF
jgi:hypothetical protein